MGFLKGFATVIFSILFFLVLFIFGIAFLVNGTVLSNDFVSNEVTKMPVSSIARDIAVEQLGDQLPQGSDFLTEVAYRVIENQEPWIKTQLNNAIKTGYDYFQGRTNTLAITVPLDELKDNLRSTLWPEFNSYLNEELTGKSDAEISAYLQDIIQQIPTSILPPDLAALPEYERNLVMEQYLRDAAGVAPKAGAPPLDPFYRSLANQYVNQYINDFVNSMPATLTLDESTIDSSTMQTLQDVRRGVGYFQTWYPWLIVLLVVLAGLIFLVNWSIKTPTRVLGIILIVIGIVDLVGIILLRTLPAVQWAADAMNTDVSPALQTWIQGLVSDIGGVLLPLTIGILVVGVALLVVSIVLPKKQKAVPVQDSNYPTAASPPPPPQRT
jgi:hypothetical protein